MTSEDRRRARQIEDTAEDMLRELGYAQAVRQAQQGVANAEEIGDRAGADAFAAILVYLEAERRLAD